MGVHELQSSLQGDQVKFGNVFNSSDKHLFDVHVELKSIYLDDKNESVLLDSPYTTRNEQEAHNFGHDLLDRKEMNAVASVPARVIISGGN